MKCDRCGCDYAESYYKYEYSDEIICEDCLLEIDGITTSTTTQYFLDGEYMGSSDEIDELYETICDNTFYKKVGG